MGQSSRRIVMLALVFAPLLANAEILIGQITGITGPIAASTKEALVGANLYLNSINAKGGVFGEKIELLVMDDKFDPKLSAPNAEVLIREKNVLALFMNRGTEHVEAVLPLMAQYGVPLIAPTSGATQLRKPLNKLIFNLRASHQHEAQKIIAHLKLIGVTRIAMVYVDDNFGNDILEGAQKAFGEQGIKPVASIKVPRDKVDIDGIVAEINKSNAQSVLWVGAAAIVSSGVKALRAAGSGVQVLTLSNNASSGFIKMLGDQAQGVVVAQVFPSERSFAFSVIREAQDAAKKANLESLSPIAMEGFFGAKLLVEALRRAGPHPTREALVKALNGLKRFDLGGLEINYSPDDHNGLDYVELSIIGADGKFKR